MTRNLIAELMIFLRYFKNILLKGTGQGYSVLEVIRAFSKSCGHEVKYKIGDRRLGDVASCYADPTLAQNELHWRATKTLQDMCDDTWRWQKMNPEGYKPVN